jgi:RNA polymerase sigma-70 factor (ECF subfamily)
MLLHESRRPARLNAEGDIVLLEDQDRSLWNKALMVEGTALVQQAFATGHIGPYTLQGAIAATHAAATTYAATDWSEIAGLYGVLAHAAPSSVVQLNRAVAIGMSQGALAGLKLIDILLDQGDLKDYHLAYAARADMLRRLDRAAEARQSYQRALSLCIQEPEQRFLQRRIAELSR